MTKPIMLPNQELVEVLKQYLHRQGDYRLVVTFQLGASNMQSQDGRTAPTVTATVIEVGIEPVPPPQIGQSATARQATASQVRM